MRSIIHLFSAVSIAMTLAQSASAQSDEMRVEQVHFSAGSTGTTIGGEINGHDIVLYKVGAEAGQEMVVNLSSANLATYFNVYGPGSGPGDQALAVGSVTGPMMPDLNAFRAILPMSGEYTVSVYLYRNAARRNEMSNYTLDISITGTTGEIVQGDFADGLQGGPDFFVVQTSDGSLNIRQAATAGAAVLTRLANGTPVRNLGCRMVEGRRWCKITTLSDPGIEGWAAGSFLVEGSDPGVVTQLPDAIPVDDKSFDAKVPGTMFHATGQIDCLRDADAAVEQCEFGVVREGNGNAMVTIFRPDGSRRVISFVNGIPVFYDQSQADAGVKLTGTKVDDDHIVFVGAERYVIPGAVISGG